MAGEAGRSGLGLVLKPGCSHWRVRGVSVVSALASPSGCCWRSDLSRKLGEEWPGTFPSPSRTGLPVGLQMGRGLGACPAGAQAGRGIPEEGMCLEGLDPGSRLFLNDLGALGRGPEPTGPQCPCFYQNPAWKVWL